MQLFNRVRHKFHTHLYVAESVFSLNPKYIISANKMTAVLTTIAQAKERPSMLYAVIIKFKTVNITARAAAIE